MPQAQKRDYSVFKNVLSSKYPAIKQSLDFDIVTGNGNGYSETYPAEEDRSHYKGRDTIEVRPKSFDFSDDEMATSLLGESLHLLKKRSPQYQQLHQDFVRSLSQKDLDFAMKRYEYARQKEGEERPFAKWFDNTWSDALVRGYIAPDRNDEFRNGGFYSPENKAVLERMRQFLETGK
jgi:hypothetical protein